MATYVLNFWLREFLLSAFANRFELRCEPKQLMLLVAKSALVVQMRSSVKFDKCKN